MNNQLRDLTTLIVGDDGKVTLTEYDKDGNKVEKNNLTILELRYQNDTAKLERNKLYAAYRFDRFSTEKPN